MGKNGVSHLKVRCDVGVRVALSYERHRISTKDVVHDACTALKVVQARQEGCHGGACVRRVQRGDVGVGGQLDQRLEQLLQVAPHVGVGAVPHVRVRYLYRRLVLE